MLGHSIVSQHFMEPVGSIPNSQELSTCYAGYLRTSKFNFRRFSPVRSVVRSEVKLSLETRTLTDTVLHCIVCKTGLSPVHSNLYEYIHIKRKLACRSLYIGIPCTCYCISESRFWHVPVYRHLFLWTGDRIILTYEIFTRISSK
jgi:hypothetical protein